MGVGAPPVEPDGLAGSVELVCGLIPQAARMAGSERALPSTRPPRLARRRNDRRDVRPSAARRAIATSIRVSSRRPAIDLSLWAMRMHRLFVVTSPTDTAVLPLPFQPA